MKTKTFFPDSIVLHDLSLSFSRNTLLLEIPSAMTSINFSNPRGHSLKKVLGYLKLTKNYVPQGLKSQFSYIYFIPLTDVLWDFLKRPCNYLLF